MTDWQEAGRKADAHRIRDLYRASFQSPAKSVARDRVIAAMQAAGVTTVLDLWGGGVSAKAFADAGLKVISVDNGSMQLVDQGRLVSKARKRRALERTAEEDGYQDRWGSVPKFAQEADGAFLDFCGPWSKDARTAIEACRHMKVVVVTLMGDHDLYTSATTATERRAILGLLLRLAYGGPLTKYHKPTDTNGRLLCHYRRPGGQIVFVFAISKKALQVGRITQSAYYRLHPDKKAAHYKANLARANERYQTDEKYREHIKQLVRTQKERNRQRRATDPEYRERLRKASREYARRHRASKTETIRLNERHGTHLRGSVPRKPCVLCLGLTP